MTFAQINIYGWVFLISLFIFIVRCAGWYLNRSMVELIARLDKTSDTPKFSYLQQWLLPKYRAGMGRFANEEFHASVDETSQNGISRISWLLLLLGASVQLGLWVYLFNFTDGQVSFLNQPM